MYHDKTDGKKKHLIVIWVKGGYGRPYRAPKDVTKGQGTKYYYIRKFSSTVIASRDEEKELFYVSSTIPFDDRECLAADIPDPTGTNMTEKIFTGPIQRQLRDALSYLKNYVIKEAVIKLPEQAEAERILNYPYAAIEEILANAVYHRSYQINEPITVRITPSEIEVTGFPGFDRSITDDDIANYDIRARFYRNRRIGDFLKELRLIEGRNTGFPNAIAALKQNGSPLMFFKQNPDRDYLSVIIPVHPYFNRPTPKQQKSESYETQLCNVLKGNPLTLTELAHALGYKGISKKLSQTVQQMTLTGKLKKSGDKFFV